MPSLLGVLVVGMKEDFDLSGTGKNEGNHEGGKDLERECRHTKKVGSRTYAKLIMFFLFLLFLLMLHTFGCFSRKNVKNFVPKLDLLEKFLFNGSFLFLTSSFSALQFLFLFYSLLIFVSFLSSLFTLFPI